MLMKRLFCAGLLLLLAACGKVYVPAIMSMTDIDPASVNNGERSLVVMRVSTPWGSPVETQWLHVETGQLVKITSQFAAGTQEKAREFDMVTLPGGHYMLAYVMYSDGTGGVWPKDPFDLDPSLSEVTRLGQVNISESSRDSGTVTVSALRSKGLGTDGRSPLIAGFSLVPGRVVYLGNMTIEFEIKGKRQLLGYYPAGRVAWSLDTGGLERARLNLAKEDPNLAEQMVIQRLNRGTLAGSR